MNFLCLDKIKFILALYTKKCDNVQVHIFSTYNYIVY